MATKMMNAKEVEEFKTHVRKKKGRRTEIQDGPKLNAEPVIHHGKTSRTTDYDVSITDLRSIMDETIWRVLREINPSIPETQHARINSDELSYVLMLSMVCGAGLDGQSGLKIRDASAGEQNYCWKHE